MNMRRFAFPFLILFILALVGCDRNLLTGSKLTLDNYNKVSVGMSKAQVETILGPPTRVEKKDMILFAKTTYEYTQGEKFAKLEFKNDELTSKDTNLGTR